MNKEKNKLPPLPPCTCGLHTHVLLRTCPRCKGLNPNYCRVEPAESLLTRVRGKRDERDAETWEIPF